MYFDLEYRDGLYFSSSDIFTFDQDTPVRVNCCRTTTPTSTDINRSPSTFVPTSRARQVKSEVWLIQLGSPGEGQLDLLPSHVIGTPPVFEYHPFHSIDFKEQVYIRKQAAQRVAEQIPTCGAEFFMDFAFMGASTSNYECPNKYTDQVVTSYEGYSSHLIIVNSASRQVWAFLTKTKEPPLDILSAFMKKFGIGNGVVRTDQGGELAHSAAYQELMLNTFGCVVESTGADSPSQNGGAEIYNNTLAVKTRTLLYGARLPAKFWSIARVSSQSPRPLCYKQDPL